MKPTSFADDNVKRAALAGTWYPGNARELGDMLDGYFKKALFQEMDGETGIIISPHAGYIYSAFTASFGFKAASSQKVNTVIVLAPSHQYSFEGAAVWPEGVFETPLGALEVDKELASRFMAFDKRFTFRRDVFEGSAGRPENSVETQLPLIKKFFPSARILPIIVGYPPDAQMVKTIASALDAAVGDRNDVLIDISVDQSHFHSLKEAKLIDARGLKAIEDMDINGFWNGHAAGEMEVDGFHVVTAGMLYAYARGFNKVKILHYETSADATGDSSRVVGYASVAFYRESSAATEDETTKSKLSTAQKARLLAIARETLDTFVRTGKAPKYNDEKDKRLLLEEGAFVTLNKHGALRGCIGNIIGSGPLYQTVSQMAVAAASEDPRFRPVKADELNDIDIEISVLSRPSVVHSAEEIELGKHGVIVSKGYLNRGVFLPQVATETGWSKDHFLAELCSQKAGLAPDSWKDPTVKLEVFTADVFGEKS